MSNDWKKILVYGFGNPGRQDDGLGILLSGLINDWCHENEYHQITTDTNYQLNLEDAHSISFYDIVIFADASEKNIPSYLLDPLNPSAQVEFSMHAVSPAFILHLCNEVFGHMPETYLLHIKGYEWEFMKDISDEARKNLTLAFEFLKSFIMKKIEGK